MAGSFLSSSWFLPFGLCVQARPRGLAPCDTELRVIFRCWRKVADVLTGEGTRGASHFGKVTFLVVQSVEREEELEGEPEGDCDAQSLW